MGWKLDQGRTAVYRIYSAEGRLLYVGCSLTPESRVRNHARWKVWGGEVASHTVEWHETRRVALDAEARAVKSEHPKYNIAYTPLFGRLSNTRAKLTVDECEAAMRAWYSGWLQGGLTPVNADDEVVAEARARIAARRAEVADDDGVHPS